MLEESIRVGQQVEKFNKTNLKFVANPFPLSYIYKEEQMLTSIPYNSKYLETFGLKPRLDTDDKFQAYEPLLEEEKKKNEIVDEIFVEMKDE